MTKKGIFALSGIAAWLTFMTGNAMAAESEIPPLEYHLAQYPLDQVLEAHQMDVQAETYGGTISICTEFGYILYTFDQGNAD